MTWVAVTGIILALGGAYVAGVASADQARGLFWLLADRVRERYGPAPVYIPVDVPEHPRLGALVATPPGGITVVRDDGAISLRADRPVTRKITADHAPTGPFAAVPYAPEPASWAEPVPSTEEVNDLFARWKRDHDTYQASYRAERHAITAPQDAAPQTAAGEAQRLTEAMQP